MLPVGVVALTCIVHAPAIDSGRYSAADTAMPGRVSGIGCSMICPLEPGRWDEPHDQAR